MSNHHSWAINNTRTNSFLPLLLLVITLLLTIQSTFGCRIHNSDSGVCTKKYLPTSPELDAIEEAKTRWQADLPYCGRFVASYYSPCVPSKPTDAWIAPDANFPNGRLAASGDSTTADEEEDVHSIRSKDAWVEQTVTRTIQARIDLRSNKDLVIIITFGTRTVKRHTQGTHVGSTSHDAVMSLTRLCPCVNQVSLTLSFVAIHSFNKVTHSYCYFVLIIISSL